MPDCEISRDTAAAAGSIPAYQMRGNYCQSSHCVVRRMRQVSAHALPLDSLKYIMQESIDKYI